MTSPETAPLPPAPTLRERDRAHVWHPYGPMPGRTDPLVVRSARGVRLTLDDGRELVDGMSSWWAAVHGYRHPALDEAVTRATGAMSHVMFGGLTHDPAVALAERLVALTPEPLEHVFLADSGSVSIEVALKMCLQYQRARGRPGRTRMMTWRGGYHGDTFGAMSVCDPEGGMHAAWSGFLPQQVFADRPPSTYDPAYDEHLRAVADAHADEVAGIVVEPVVQGAGGMRFHDPRHLRALREIADAHDLVLVFDEIATGFGRTGTLFAAEQAGVAPDVMCLGKALTGGYLTMAAALCTPAVATAISAGEAGGLMHGPTFMANPLAATVAAASVDELLRRDWAGEVAALGAGLRESLAPARDVPGVRDVRVLGGIGVVQLDHPVDVPAAQAAAEEHGVWLRPFRDLVYAMPPYVTPADDVLRIGGAMVAAARVA
ncbi:adenosylmethionine--8-amino-7-oxononanoate transaminase [Actinomycetospora lemnae]|uniref:Adenosylmethionine-8-amino-7-oxononanoate aminotransferase n=1 Tax=Actinomycetospora lemnae TaxID=3019891 RepID=A0ABT5T4J0_9PSEU|nr:adenosylmethionine--8-amino-7-oxononanoate transaminase [Actinomycetospora sp. DW7H6]MDD7968853.1 adenosylmethionine--8-amino-7-oxononanoate transaminase [Actinomycetospora sp. DW7H6]